MSVAVLLLAGTGEARHLADLLAAMEGVAATASLAGVTAAPAPYAVPLRRGGFGGAAGLAAHLRRHGVAALIDATHPFAATMQENARLAAAETGVPLLRLARAPWPQRPGWRRVGSLAGAAAVLPAGARVFLATGAKSLPAFAGRTDLAVVARVIDPPPDVPPHVTLIADRPPFDAAAEAALLLRLGTTHLVARNSGGAEGMAKLAAAEALGIVVVMIDRPPGAVPGVETPQAAVDWLRALLAVRSVNHA